MKGGRKNKRLHAPISLHFLQLVDCFSLDWVHSHKGPGTLDVIMFLAVDTAAHVLNAWNLLQHVNPWNAVLASALTVAAAKVTIFNENSAWCDPKQIPDEIRKRLQTIA